MSRGIYETDITSNGILISPSLGVLSASLCGLKKKSSGYRAYRWSSVSSWKQSTKSISALSPTSVRCKLIVSSTGIVQSSTGSNYVVRILSTLDREKLKPSSSVALHRHSNSLVDILPPEADSSIAMLGVDEKPDVTYADVGGLDMQKQEIREAVELPLTHFDLYKQIGMVTNLDEANGIC